jgi:cytoskeleton protein RodZ
MVEVRRNGRLAAVIAVAATLVGVAFLTRGGGAVALGVVLLALAAVHAWSAWDARTPLAVVDEHGIRFRLARTWRGLPWSEIDEVEHRPRPRGPLGWWRDGRLSVLPVDNAAQLDDLSGLARWLGRLSMRLYGVAYAVPLGLGTTVTGAGDGLADTLAALAPASVDVVEIDPTMTADGLDLADTAERPAIDAAAVEAPGPEPTVPVLKASPTPSPLREPAAAVRAEVVGGSSLAPVSAPFATSASGDAEVVPLVPLIRMSPDETHVVFDDLVDSGIVPAAEPVIGPELAAARARVGLTVDQLAERTRIRPHVIESIEVDDFTPCGGDFYARGHLRTLARVLGIDAAPLLNIYDETYAHAPVNPRAVFEAELATGQGGLRRMRGGPNWSVLVASVMAVVLIWSVARLVMAGSPVAPAPQISLDSGSSGTTNPYGKVAAPVPVTLTAAGGGAHVVVRDASGSVVFTGDLAFGQSKTLQASPPVRVQTSDGSLAVSVQDAKPKAIGSTGQPAQRTYTAH